MSRNVKIKAARAELDMTQKALAEAVGISRQTMNAIEQGDYNPTIKLCRAICRVLGKTLDELFGEEDEMMMEDGAMYCEKCKLSFEGSICPSCGNKKVRQVNKNDFCFLVKKDHLWAGLVADILSQHQIPFVVQNELGAGLTAQIGSLFERSSFFVPYGHLQGATALIDEIFPDDSI